MPDKQPYHHKDLRNAIIEKGIEFVGKNGVKELSIRKVATACGVSHGAPYFHFANKDELLIAMQEHITEQFCKILEQVIAEYAGRKDIILQLGVAYVNFFLENPSYFHFIYSFSNISIYLYPGAGQQGFRPFEIYKKVLTEYLNGTSCPKEKYEDIALALLAEVHGIAALATMQNINYNENWKEKVLNILQVFTCTYFEAEL